MTKSGRLELGDNVYEHQVYIHPLWRIWPAKQSNSVKMQNTGYYAVQVIQDNRGRYQSKARMQLPISD